jgi:uncharacterized protein (TIGR03437 family)
VCRISTSGLNRNRLVTGPVHVECPISIHTVPFGNWGATSNFGNKQNAHQFEGWCHDTPICDNRGNCRTECGDGWYEWNSCTDIDEFRAPNCTLYNDKNCTAQATTTGQNVHGTLSVDVTVRCPTDTDANGAVDQGGCADLKMFSNGTNFLSLYEIDPGTTDDLIQTLYFPESPVSLACTVFGCAPAQSLWVLPNAYDSPTAPAKVSAEFAMAVNSAVFVDTSRACRVVGPAVNTVSGASFRGPAVAPESIASAFGEGLAVARANAIALPLPFELAGTSVSITDAAGVRRAAPLFYVSPEQINFQVPTGTAAGLAQVAVSRTDTVTSRGTVQVASTAPGLFAANANGQGVAAATALRLNANGTTSVVPVFQCGSTPPGCVPNAIGLDNGPVYLSLYGTGLRGVQSRQEVTLTIGGVPAEVLFAGPHSQYIGLDQVNVVIPAALRGRGAVDIAVLVGQNSSNTVSIAIH